MKSILLAAVLSAQVAAAQTSADELRQKVLSLHYPSSASAARIMGDVRLTVDSGGITAVSGHPLLRQAAIENTKSLGLPATVTVTYHFVLSDTSAVLPVSTTVKKGDPFDRFFLRILGMKTERVIHSDRCVALDPPNDVKVSQDGIEVWINAVVACILVSSGV